MIDFATYCSIEDNSFIAEVPDWLVAYNLLL